MFWQFERHCQIATEYILILHARMQALQCMAENKIANKNKIPQFVFVVVVIVAAVWQLQCCRQSHNIIVVHDVVLITWIDAYLLGSFMRCSFVRTLVVCRQAGSR